MRPRSSTIVPGMRGALAPYPRFLPREVGQSGVLYSLARRTMACTSSTLPGASAAEAGHSFSEPGA